MFAPDGYEPLASLWIWFEDKFGSFCVTKSIEFYNSSAVYTPGQLFGSPRDLCEDLFLRSLEAFQITLIGAEVMPVHVTPILSNSRARLFEKSDPLESFCTAAIPEDAGPENEWLIQMGSTQFSPSGKVDTEVTEWLQAKYSGNAGDQLVPRLQTRSFHTLPFLFERGSFVFPSKPPPWANDMIEDGYFQNLKNKCGGRAMCLSDKRAAKWRRSLTKAKLEQLLGQQLPVFSEIEPVTDRTLSGRPQKKDKVIDALLEMNLIGSELSRKEILRRVENRLGDSIGMRTLDRALKACSRNDSES